MDIKAQYSIGNEYFINGDIGFEVDATDVIAWLGHFHEQEVTFTIFSGGGSLFDALAIRAYAIKHSIKVTANIYGFAASAATIIAAAAGRSRTYIDPSSQYMIHWAFGGSESALKNANETVVQIYMELTGRSKRAITKLLDDGTNNDTFLNATEMAELGFGQVMDSMAIAATYKTKIQNLKDMSEEKTDVKVIKLSLKDIVTGKVEIDREMLNNEALNVIQDELGEQIEMVKASAEKVNDLEASAKEDATKIEELEAKEAASIEAKVEANKEAEASNETIKALEATIAENATEIEALKKAPAVEAAANSGDDVQAPGDGLAEGEAPKRKLSKAEQLNKELTEAHNERYGKKS